MDAIDQKLLNLLGENSRMSLKQLSALVELSRTATTERIRKLEQSGDIVGYTIRRADEEAATLLFVSTYEASCESLATRFHNIPEIRAMRSLAGDIDIILDISNVLPARLHAIREEIAQMPEVKHIATAPILKCHWLR